jgi:hypothetical protein
MGKLGIMLVAKEDRAHLQRAPGQAWRQMTWFLALFREYTQVAENSIGEIPEKK